MAQESPLEVLVGGIVATVFWGWVLVSCSTQKPEPKLDTGRFLPHVSTSDECAYMFSDGSIAKYARHGECKAWVVDELEAE